MKKYNPNINYILRSYQLFLKKTPKTFTLINTIVEPYELCNMIQILHRMNSKFPSLDIILKAIEEFNVVIEINHIKNLDELCKFSNTHNLRWMSRKPIINDAEFKSGELHLVYNIKTNRFLRRISPSKCGDRTYLKEEEFYEWYPIFLKKINWAFYHFLKLNLETPKK